jgi:hypothetical protein
LDSFQENSGNSRKIPGRIPGRITGKVTGKIAVRF